MFRINSQHKHIFGNGQFVIEKGDNEFASDRDIPEYARARLKELQKSKNVTFFEGPAPKELDAAFTDDHPEAANGDANHANSLREKVQHAGSEGTPIYDHGHVGTPYADVKKEEAETGVVTPSAGDQSTPPEPQPDAADASETAPQGGRRSRRG